MTVFNTNYSTLEQAWGESYLSPSLQKKSKKKKPPPQSDPICDLYEMGNNNYTENDIVSYANKFYEKHEKGKYQKPRMLSREKNPKVVDFEYDDGLNVGAPFNSDVSMQMKRMMDDEESQRPNRLKQIYSGSADDSDEDDTPQVRNNVTFKLPPAGPPRDERADEEDANDINYVLPQRSSTRDRVLYDTHEYYVGDEDPDFYKRNANFNYFDVVLYVISGIILIFMMEQFVKIGMLLH
jgi:hypothetical protein